VVPKVRKDHKVLPVSKERMDSKVYLDNKVLPA
jgi:hypothetical protein